MTCIVAVAGRYPGSAPDTGIQGFWHALELGSDLPSPVPLQRWDIDEYFSPDGRGKQLSMYVRMAAYVDNLDSFDASLFRCFIPLLQPQFEIFHSPFLHDSTESLDHSGLAMVV